MRAALYARFNYIATTYHHRLRPIWRGGGASKVETAQPPGGGFPGCGDELFGVSGEAVIAKDRYGAAFRC